jgi:hypothetical protein
MTGSHIPRSLYVSESQQLVYMGTYLELFFGSGVQCALQEDRL